MRAKSQDKIICLLFSLLCLGGFLLTTFLPKAEFSMSERRRLAPKPVLSVENILSGKYMADFEKYATDHVPFRDFFRQSKARSATQLFLRKDNHGIYRYKGYAVKMEYPLKEASVERAGSRFAFIREKYLTGNRVFVSIIPDKNYFLGKESGHLVMDYARMQEILLKKMPFAEYIDIFPKLSIEDYYGSDTHWKQESIVGVAKALTEAMGTKVREDYEIVKVKEDFLGVYYGQSGFPLAKEPLSYLSTPDFKQMKVMDFQNNKEIGLYNMDKAFGRDAYEMFLDGNLSIVTVENSAQKNGKELIVFRDSFGSSIAPLLATAYAKVTFVDIRAVSSARLDNWIDFKDSDILFLYSTLVLNNSETMK